MRHNTGAFTSKRRRALSFGRNGQEAMKWPVWPQYRQKSEAKRRRRSTVAAWFPRKRGADELTMVGATCGMEKDKLAEGAVEGWNRGTIPTSAFAANCRTHACSTINARSLCPDSRTSASQIGSFNPQQNAHSKAGSFQPLGVWNSTI